MNPKFRDESGAVALLTAVLAVMMFGLAAIVVDLGIARDNRRQAQNTADAAALAAANALYATKAANLNQPGDFQAAVDAAKEFAAKNYGTTDEEWAGCVNPEPLGFQFPGTGTSCISFDKFLYPKEVLVVVPLRKQASMFGGVFGYTGVSVGALAQAKLDPGGPRICTFCVLGGQTHNLQNGTLTVTGGNLWFNGDLSFNSGSATSNLGPVLGDDGTTFEDGGNAYVSGTVNSPGNVKGNLQIGQPKIVDPLAADVLPFATQATLTAKTDPCAGEGPGIYDGYSSTGGTCNITVPGLYVFTDDFVLAGNAGVIADGVTMYFTCGDGSCDPGEQGAKLDLAGNGDVQLTAPLKATHPTLPAELWGYAVVFDRNNDSVMNLTGNGASTVSGTIYGVNTTLDFRGNGGGVVPFSSWVVVESLIFKGSNAALTVDFDASKNRKPSEGVRGLVR